MTKHKMPTRAKLGDTGRETEYIEYVLVIVTIWSRIFIKRICRGVSWGLVSARHLNVRLRRLSQAGTQYEKDFECSER